MGAFVVPGKERSAPDKSGRNFSRTARSLGCLAVRTRATQPQVLSLMAKQTQKFLSVARLYFAAAWEEWWEGNSEGVRKRRAGKTCFQCFQRLTGVKFRWDGGGSRQRLVALLFAETKYRQQWTFLTKIVQDFTFRGERRQDIRSLCGENPTSCKQRLDASDHFNCLDASLLLLCTLPRHLPFLKCLFWLLAQFLRKP